MNRRGFLGMMLGALALPFARGGEGTPKRDDLSCRLPQGSYVVKRHTPVLDSQEFADHLHKAVKQAVQDRLIQTTRQGGDFQPRYRPGHGGFV